MWRVSRFFLPRQVREIETTTRSRPERMQWHCKEIDGSGRFSYSAPRMLAAAADANALSAAATKSRAVAAAAEEERTTAAELLPISSSGGVSPSSANAALREAQRSAGDAAEDAVLEETNDAREVEENGASEAESGCRRATLLKRILRDTAPRILVVAGPSGVGKGTLVKRIFAKWPQAFGFSISHTSRQPRPGETHGKEYFFCSREEFEKLKKEGHFVESAEFSGNCYGTSFAAVDNVRRGERICLLEIDMAGVLQIQSTPLAQEANFVFIQPPSIEELKARLRGRRTENEEHIAKRLAAAQRELALAKETHFDFYLTNDNLEDAWQKLEAQLVQWYGPVFKKAAGPGEKRSRLSEEETKAEEAKTEEAKAEEAKAEEAKVEETKVEGNAGE
ncbi:guanylate kinase family protein [Toxoplasma gondii TgCatPRC2]|uniref:guanylate kinase n=5 Tax=Toxoplasma gondii TaxID=5811 RepID=A0A0F7USG2_TOXGV|nr:guanylate kinase family protein [Toxoplasma gondii ME49]EPT30418.1 guanylate kinase family protein [Toxoplasma gondii ME49]KYK72180.1 guanylate kinase family protein [Toxoplasma gondii TgCatPRC2]CEL73090.1 TPA: guanylate kinase, putative [Toxoplasma gondii VEG]|eukprot:XP_018637493.1 guanylate kinase family protein [Toxoplasma gondii ME49]